MLKNKFGSHKPIIAMVHFPPLPGTPLYDAKGGMQKIIDSAAKDIVALQKGGAPGTLSTQTESSDSWTKLQSCAEP